MCILKVYLSIFHLYIYVYMYIYIYKYISYIENKYNHISDVRGPKIPKISPQMFRTKIVHTSGIFFDLLGGGFSIFGSKSIFNLCSYIEFNTQNLNPILKITISFTKTQKMPKYFRNVGTLSKHRKYKK